jgi:hypothetical protein
MSNDQILEAKKYLEIHKIPQLLQQMAAATIYYKPENPRLFLIDQLKLLKDFKSGLTDSAPIILFTKENIKKIFDDLDVHKTNYLTYEQCKSALDSFGIQNFSSPATNKIDFETFNVEM